MPKGCLKYKTRELIVPPVSRERRPSRLQHGRRPDGREGPALLPERRGRARKKKMSPRFGWVVIP